MSAGGIFYNLGRMAGPHYRKAAWVWHSVAGSESDALRLERQVGADLAGQIKQHYKPDLDPKSERLLAQVGSKLTACVANPLRSFSFEALQAGAPNAFAMPGGYVFVSRSLLELCQQDEDEIAFVLGHEMGHVIMGHAINRLITSSAIALGSRAVPVRGAASILLSSAGIKFLESSYSQEQELQADELGARLLAAAGYNPQACATVLTRLSKLSPAGGESDLSHYFSSHPAFELRIAALIEKNTLLYKL